MTVEELRGVKVTVAEPRGVKMTDLAGWLV